MVGTPAHMQSCVWPRLQGDSQQRVEERARVLCDVLWRGQGGEDFFTERKKNERAKCLLEPSCQRQGDPV